MLSIRSFCKKIVLITVIISLLITFLATPSANAAKLNLKEGEFYYSGTTKGTYTVTENVWEWLINSLAEIADWLLGIMTMGFRMVFVGWTALFEKLLTWALETTTGVNVSGELVENSTDQTSLSDSTNNLTVEAIVYNKVPALDINFFKEAKYDPSYSGTGQKLICEKCDKPVDDPDCCGKMEENSGKYTLPNANKCSCDGCDPCTKYKQAVESYGGTIIDDIKELVAKWYYILRLLSIAAMLLILIVMAIKAMLTSVAAEKALFKKMLADWLAGFIIIFFIHFIIYAIIHINEIGVSTVHDVAYELNKDKIQELSLMQLAEKDGTDLNQGRDDGTSGYTSDELEIKVYEEIRTRAYDARLTVGLTGMIMYMTLVYFAVRYTIVYVKRYFTIIVLTLMGPTVGAGFAIQKVLSGKAPSLTKWLTEYISIVFIQIIHAILYSVFVIQALILSLESISGMIIALVFLNFILKADKLFRKIFKVGTGGSIAGEAADANPEDVINSVKSVGTMVLTAKGAKALGSTLLKTPIGAATRTAGKVVGAVPVAVGMGISAGVNSVRERINDRNPEESPSAMLLNNTSNGNRRSNKTSTRRNTNSRNVSRRKQAKVEKKSKDLELLQKGEKKLKKEYYDARDELKAAASSGDENRKKAALQKVKEADSNLNRFNKLVTSSLNIGKVHVQRAFSMDNVYKVKGNYAATIWKNIVGTKHRDPETGEMVSDGNALYKRLSPRVLLGLNDDDIKDLKEGTGFIKKGLLGTMGVLLGMSTIVANPKMGMAFLGAGIASSNQVYGARAKKPKMYKGKYTFNRFSAKSVDTIAYSIRDDLEEAKTLKEKAQKILRKPYVFPVLKTFTYVPRKMAARMTTGTRMAEKFEEIKKNAEDRNKKLFKEDFVKFEKETAQVMKAELIADMELLAKKSNKKDKKKEEDKIFRKFEEKLKRSGFKYNRETGEIEPLEEERRSTMGEVGDGSEIPDGNAPSRTKHNRSGSFYDDAREEEKEGKDKKEVKLGFANLMLAAYLADSSKKASDKVSDGQLSDNPNERISEITKEKEINEENEKILKEALKDKELSQVEITVINKEIDLILEKLANGELFDVNDAKSYNLFVRQLESRLFKLGIITDSRSMEDIFNASHFKKSLKAMMKNKATKLNKRIEASNKALETMLQAEEAEIVQEAVKQLVAEQENTTHISNTEQDIKTNNAGQKTNNAGQKTNEEKDNIKPPKITAEKVLEKVKEIAENRKIANSNSTQEEQQPNDMPQDENVSEGLNEESTTINIYESLKENPKQQVIEAYIDNILKDTISAENVEQAYTETKQEIPEIVAEREEKAKKRREKMKQIIDFSMDSQDETDRLEDTFEDLYDMKEFGGSINVDGKEVTLSKDEIDEQLEMLLIVKQMRALNEISVEELKVKSKVKTQTFIEDIKRLELAKNEFERLKNDEGENSPKVAAANEEVERLQQNLDGKEKQQRIDSKNGYYSGPFIDIKKEVDKTLESIKPQKKKTKK